MYDTNVLVKYGINIDKCLEIFGDIETYNEVLKEFIEEVDNKVMVISNYLDNLQINSYMIEVHNLKNDARYLGFDTLARIASEIEGACTKNDVTFLKEHHQKFIETIKHYVGIANLYFAEKPSQEIDNSINPVHSNVLTTSNGDIPVLEEQSEEPVIIQTINNPIPDESFIKINLNKSNDVLPIVKPKLLKDKILIADDSNIVTRFVDRILSKDYDVVIVKNGTEAIKLLDNPEFRENLKLCLIDLNMPEIDGYRVLEYCKEKNYFENIPFAVESGVEDTVSLDKVNSYPIVGILLKPFKEADLRRILEKSNSTYF